MIIYRAIVALGLLSSLVTHCLAERVKVDLGASVDVVIGDAIRGEQTFESRGMMAPHVRFKLSVAALRGLLLENLSEGVEASKFLSRFNEIIKTQPGSWVRESRGFVVKVKGFSDPPLMSRFKGDSLQFVLPDGYSYNHVYELSLDMKPFQPESMAEKTLFQDSLKWSGRTAISLATIGKEEHDLITGKGVFERGVMKEVRAKKENAYSAIFKTSVAGVPNFVESFLFRRSGLYSVTLDATLSEFALDSKSAITVSFGGLTNSFDSPTFAPFVSLKGSTSQSLKQTEFFLEPGLRVGDKRTYLSSSSGAAHYRPTKDGADPSGFKGYGYFSNDEAIDDFYAEFKVQLGGTFRKNLPFLVEGKDFRTGFGPKFLFRPVMTIGLKELSPEILGRWVTDRLQLKIDGTTDIYTMIGSVSGSDVSGAFEGVASIKVTLGPKGRQLSIGAKFGPNPNDGFSKQRPVYSIGYEIKY